ncbi:hypothetical protein NDA11_002724 [Ustilago hordei]|uniref:Protein SQS1 n=1 Tax=Ustilago hordei TaxID=120017 RepID=I2G6R8_USTHO|nr:uncharacterized protein UHO2_02213 [Ustilago hordei]KAJ1585932.1 hypothetical protein NDA12_003271 [Ustilago hordei]KAJ1589534.1 hypothetical protein NDA15_006318 [Ustilago hordei]KAJ1590793.1 hypothetical protein NDA11_002724 [Ustilago hordei]CCF54861.1 uncharacterized protein UHOR_01369 [Ustilago hordei]SYW85979.1 uncharacterized protein UHO2_02213 [Ustilago hordei]
MGKNKGNGGGVPTKGRVPIRGGRGRGGGLGGRGGFQPFAEAGHVLGGASGSGSGSGHGSPRGGAANGRPFRGRGRGGHLSVSGQNRVGFDYSALSRGSRRDYNDDQDNKDEDDEDEADFAIDPPAGYKHKIKPHLEKSAHSDIESDTAKLQSSFQTPNVPSGSSTHQCAFSITINNHGSSSMPRFTPRSTAPVQFPEFYTSRGSASGAKFRPPEETEDSKYLAGIPGLRRPERRQQRNAPQLGDPADQVQSPFRVPLAFVKSTGEYGDPLKGNLPPRDPEDTSIDPAAKQLEEARQQQLNNPPAQRRHACLGFSNRPAIKPAAPAQVSNAEAPVTMSTPAPQTTATPYVPPRAVLQFTDMTVNAFDFNHDAINADDQDEVNALLAAFPGSKELAPGESMFEDDAASSWTLPAFQPEAVKPIQLPTNTSQRNAENPVFAASAPAKSAAQPAVDANKPLSRISATSSDDDEEIILVPLQGQTPRGTAAKPSPAPAPTEMQDEVEAAPTAGVEVVEETDLGFVIDLEGEDPAAPIESPPKSIATSTSHRVVLGDAARSASKSNASSRKKQSATRGKPRRIPREGDSDLDWGNDGPPGGSGDVMGKEEGLTAAAAGISITRNSNEAEVITDPILAKAIRADRHEWESADDNDNDITMDMVQPKKRGRGQRAKRSTANRAAASRTAAQNARSRKADQDAIIADYMENILIQGNDSSDDDKEGLFETDDMVVETVDGDLPAGISDKGKAKARRLSNQLDDKTDVDAMIRFMNGMDPQKGGRQLGFGDIDDEIHMDEVKEWLTESEADSDDDDVEDAATADVNGHPAEVKSSKKADKQDASGSEDEDLAEQLRIILEDDDDEESSEVFSEDSSSDSEGDDTRQAEYDDSDDSDSDSDSDDDDDGMFRGKNSWADEDEEFIRALSSQVGGAGTGSRLGAAPSSKRAQKKLFNANSRGDFNDLMDLVADENEIDSDDPAYGLGSIPTARNGKRKGRKFTAEDLWAEELQQQWDKDRASKASKKQQRLMERQAASLNPFPNTHGKAGSAGKTKSTKKQSKLARKAGKREMRASLKAHSNNVVSAINVAGSIDDVDQNILMFGGNSVPGDVMSLGLEKRFAFNMDELNQQIQMFLSEKGRNTMRCQPMDKFARAEVHALAAAYNLASKSKGKGRERFPTLIKTSKSGLNVDYRKVKRIVWSNAGATFGSDLGRSDFKDKSRGKKGKRGGGGGGGVYGVGGGTVPKNREGEEVGFGADKIGADNIGHKLLAAMGWREGSGIGSSQGMANPVSATVKTSKGGLGF